jgi:hypothetical protein
VEVDSVKLVSRRREIAVLPLSRERSRQRRQQLPQRLPREQMLEVVWLEP